MVESYVLLFPHSFPLLQHLERISWKAWKTGKIKKHLKKTSKNI